LDILIAGVGGQGTILVSKILAGAALLGGGRVRTGETIGMSQRGGCVVSHVRTGAVSSSYIPPGGADLLLALELCEGARNLPRLKATGAAVVSTARLEPVTAALGQEAYEEETMRAYIAARPRARFIPADRAARALGSEKAANIVLLGAAFAWGLLTMDEGSLLAALAQNTPPAFAALNRAAWRAGAEAARNAADDREVTG
jgi:indolepyruvate ferredoxin oxidoreductase beta subunit